MEQSALLILLKNGGLAASSAGDDLKSAHDVENGSYFCVGGLGTVSVDIFVRVEVFPVGGEDGLGTAVVDVESLGGLLDGLVAEDDEGKELPFQVFVNSPIFFGRFVGIGSGEWLWVGG